MGSSTTYSQVFVARRSSYSQVFVGRDAERALLKARFDVMSESGGQVVLVEGRAGIGKSALARWARGAMSAATVVEASATEDEQDVPFALVEQLLSGLPTADELQPHLDPHRAGALLVERLGELAGRAGPALVVVEDLQWADHPSLSALLFALRRIRRDHVLSVLNGDHLTRGLFAQGPPDEGEGGGPEGGEEGEGEGGPEGGEGQGGPPHFTHGMFADFEVG